jgi:hypothetical protein
MKEKDTARVMAQWRNWMKTIGTGELNAIREERDREFRKD